MLSKYANEPFSLFANSFNFQCLTFNFHYQSSERFLRIVYMFSDYPSISAPLQASGQVRICMMTRYDCEKHFYAELCSASTCIRNPLARHQHLMTIVAQSNSLLSWFTIQVLLYPDN